MNARATAPYALPLTVLCLAVLAALPSAQAADGPFRATGDCSGDVEVQHQLTNDHSCEGCRGSVIVQVGLTNRVECRGDCSGNVVVQVGLENSVDCGNGLSSRTLGGQESVGPCPRPLPDGNFYCHVLGRTLPEELCLSLDFCLW